MFFHTTPKARRDSSGCAPSDFHGSPLPTVTNSTFLKSHASVKASVHLLVCKDDGVAVQPVLALFCPHGRILWRRFPRRGRHKPPEPWLAEPNGKVRPYREGKGNEAQTPRNKRRPVVRLFRSTSRPQGLTKYVSPGMTALNRSICVPAEDRGVDRKVLLDTSPAGLPIDFRNSAKGPNCISDVVNQKTGLPNHLTARAEIHCDDGHATAFASTTTSPNRSGMVFRCRRTRARANSSFLPVTSTGPI